MSASSNSQANVRNYSGPARGHLLLVSPTTQETANPVRFEGEGVTDVLEGERPAHIVRLEPLGRLPEQPLASHPPGERASAEGPDRIFEHGRHEPQLRRPFGRALQELGELHRQEVLGSELPRISGLFDSPTETRSPHEPLPCPSQAARARGPATAPVAIETS